MKIYSNNLIQLFSLISANKINAILLHGPNYGLSNVIFDQISKKQNCIKTSLSLKSDGLAALEQRSSMNNFFGQKELIKVTNFNSNINKATKEFLEKGSFNNLICFISQDSLPPSGIRKLFEGSKTLASVGCYHDDASTISNIILKKLSSLGKHIEEDALFYIKTHIAGDRMLLANELKKIIFYCANKNTITLKDVNACLGTQLLSNGDEMCLYFANKEYDKFLAEIATMKEQNINEVLMIRALQRFYMNLYIAISYYENGMNIDMAIKKLLPPVFFKLVPRFKATMAKFSSHDARQMIKKLLYAEIAFKSNNKSFDLFMYLTSKLAS